MRKLLPLLGPLAIVAVSWACADKSFVGPGGECFQAIDCQAGLVCVPENGTTRRICTNDLTGISNPPPNNDSGTTDAVINADADPDALVDTSAPQDVTPPIDTGGGTDTGSGTDTGGGTDSGGGTD